MQTYYLSKPTSTSTYSDFIETSSYVLKKNFTLANKNAGSEYGLCVYMKAHQVILCLIDEEIFMGPNFQHETD